MTADRWRRMLRRVSRHSPVVRSGLGVVRDERVDDVGGQDAVTHCWRILGSRKPYETSTSRLTIT